MNKTKIGIFLLVNFSMEILFNYEYFANLRIFRKQAIASRLIIVNV